MHNVFSCIQLMVIVSAFELDSQHPNRTKLWIPRPTHAKTISFRIFKDPVFKRTRAWGRSTNAPTGSQHSLGHDDEDGECLSSLVTDHNLMIDRQLGVQCLRSITLPRPRGHLAQDRRWSSFSLLIHSLDKSKNPNLAKLLPIFHNNNKAFSESFNWLIDC